MARIGRAVSTPEPLTDERRDEIGRLLKLAPFAYGPSIARELLAEVDRQAAEIVRLRAVIEREMDTANRHWLASERGNNGFRRLYGRLKRDLAAAALPGDRPEPECECFPGGWAGPEWQDADDRFCPVHDPIGAAGDRPDNEAVSDATAAWMGETNCDVFDLVFDSDSDAIDVTGMDPVWITDRELAPVSAEEEAL
jgi:hypothetical protein